MDIAWDDLKLFLAVAETGSFSGAARALRLGQPTVSRRLADLEYALGYKLFRRSAGGATPTSIAARMLEPTRRMAEWAGEAGRTAQSADRAPQGIVRLAAPPGIAFEFLAPFAAALRATLPKVQIELLSKVEYLDLGRGEADLALRLKAPPAGGDLMAIASIELENAVFVSRSLAAELPPAPPLNEIPWLGWAPPYETLPPNPQIESWGGKPVFTTDNYLVMVQAAESGLGAMVQARWNNRFSRPSELVPLGTPLGPFSKGSTHLVCAKSALDVPRIRAVADELAKELRQVGTRGAVAANKRRR